MTMTGHDNPIDAPAPQRSRRWILGAVGVTAAAAGIASAWWRNGRQSPPAPEGLWARQWASPTGLTFSMQSFQGRPLLINFWATWCPPCIEELPLIEAFYQENKAKSWQVLGLAVDKSERVQGFLNSNHLSFPIGMAGLEGTQLSRELGNVGGGLPFTVVFSSDGQIAQRKLGRLQAQDLAQWRGLT